MKEQIAAHYLMPCKAFFELLSKDIRPRTAMKKAEEIQTTLRDNWMQQNPLESDDETPSRLTFSGVSIEWSESSGLRIEPDGYGPLRISPEGAKLAIKLYEAGHWFSKAPKSLTPVPQTLTDYANSGEALAELTRKENAERDALWEQMNYPDSIKPEQFTYSLLNEVFIRHFGLESGFRTMLIGDIKVTKYVRAYSSNSGKTKDYEVKFSWTAPDGTEKSLTKDSAYTQNRRNDAERNHGLPNRRGWR